MQMLTSPCKSKAAHRARRSNTELTMMTILFSLALLAQSDRSWDAGVAALQAGRAAEAQVLLENACPAFADDADRGYCLLLLGTAHQGAGNLLPALESFESSLALLPRQNVRYADARAMAHRYLGELIGSEDH